MPELPEVEALRRTLEPAIIGRPVLGVTVHRRDVVARENDPFGGWSRASADHRAAAARRGMSRVPKAELLVGCTIDRLERRGKQLLIVGVDQPSPTGRPDAERGATGASRDLDADRRGFIVHLGMTGSVLYRPAGARLDQRDHIHLTWRLGPRLGPRPDVPNRDPDAADAGGRLVFRDPRRFGGVRTGPDLRTLREARWRPLGPDALSVDAADLARAASARPIKALLLDQHAVAGVGNIYADEALFAAGIHPLTPAGALDEAARDALARAIREILGRAIDAGGSTLRDYRDATGRAGGFQHAHEVYGRSGEPCTRCGQPLVSALIAQRTTVWCRRCQPEPMAAASGCPHSG